MAEAVETMGTEMSVAVEPAAQDDVIVFGGEKRNMAMGIAMFGAGAAAFISGLTDTFFAEAIAWTFMLWGIFFLYGDLLLTTRRFEVREDGLTLKIPFRLWSRQKEWAWQDINRMDIVMQRRDLKADTASLQIYHQYPKEITLEREDRDFDPELARIIIARAKLKPDGAAAAIDLNDLPLEQALVFTWKK